MGVFASSRIGLGLVLIFAIRLPAAAGLSRFLAYWDGGWYLEIAQHGYPRALLPAPAQTDHAFFPLYPLLIRAAHAVSGSWVGSAVAIEVVGSALAMAAIHLLVERLTDARVALRTVALLSFFPWAFIFSIAYTEGLFMLLAAICLLALLDERWLLAGLTALVAGALRPTGFVLVFPCAWAALAAARRTRSPAPLVAPVLAPLGILGFFAYLRFRTGDFLANLHARDRGWSMQHFQFQLSQFPKVMSTYLAHPLVDLDRSVSFAALALAVACLVLMARWWRPPAILWLYTVPILLLAAYYDTYASMPRFVLTAFPLFVPLAQRLKGPALWAVLTTMSMLMVAIFLLVGTTTWLVP